MTELQRAVIFLQEARVKIDEAARQEADDAYKLELMDVADNIETVLHTLKGMGVRA